MMKLEIKQFSILFILIVSHNTLFGQIERAKYVFEMDKAIDEFRTELKNQDVDTLLEASYHFDNGRGEKATFLFAWKKGGLNYSKVIKYKKNNRCREFPIEECPEFDNILNFYNKNAVKITSSEPKSEIVWSHNYGYSINLKFDKTGYKTYLRDEKRIDDANHFKSQWINKIDKIVQPYLLK